MRRATRNSATIRILSLLRTLQGGRRWTLTDLAALSGVTTRTVRRDLDVLQVAGYAIGHEERGDDGAGPRGMSGTWWLL